MRFPSINFEVPQLDIVAASNWLAMMPFMEQEALQTAIYQGTAETSGNNRSTAWVLGCDAYGEPESGKVEFDSPPSLLCPSMDRAEFVSDVEGQRVFNESSRVDYLPVIGTFAATGSFGQGVC